MSTLGDALREHAQTDAIAVYAGERAWTYAELVEAAEARRLDVDAGDAVALVMARGIDAIVALSAAALAGAVPAMIDPGDRQLARRTLDRLRPRVALFDDGTVERRDDAIRRDGLAVIIFTSGSTADSKGVAWSETRASYDWTHSPPAPLQREAPAGIAVPLCTALGLQDAMRSLFHGLSIALLDAPFPIGLEQARARGVNRLKLTPSHVDMLLASAVELPALRIIQVASAPIAPAKLRELAGRFPHARVGRTYGLTESGGATLVWADRTPGRIHTVGRPISDRAITIRDANDRVLVANEWGEVVIAMPAWAPGDGYLDAPPALARRFADGILRTGDRGMIDRDGFLHLGARLAEIIKVGGRSVAAPRIEQTLRRDGDKLAVVGVPDRALGEAPCAIYAFGTNPRGMARRAARPDEVPRWFLPRHYLPTTPSNKIRRGVLAREAKRWVATWTATAAPDHRTRPAYELENNLVVVDAGIEQWLVEFPARGRLIVLADRRPFVALAFAYLEAQKRARFVVGPFAIPRDDEGRTLGDTLRDVFAAELVHLVTLLPGAPSSSIYTRAASPTWTARGPEIAGVDFERLDALAGELQRRSAAISR